MSSVQHLPEEIVSNILVRLPVRDLIRYMCVSKAWYYLITDQNFISTHFNFHCKTNGYLLLHQMGGWRNFFSMLHNNTCVEHSSFEVPFSCETIHFQLAGSVNGLICLCDSYQFFGKTIYLWNPCIWKLKILRGSCFARHFEDVQIFFSVGIAFDQLANDLKIVRIMYFGDFYIPVYVEKKPPKVEVYLLATNSWRRIGTNAGYYTNDKLSTTYVHGAVHWVGSKAGEGRRGGNLVLSFDFESEKFGEIMLPKYHPDADGEIPEVSLAVLRSSIVLIVSCFNNHEIEHCDIWLMREYGKAESWTKEYSIVPEERLFTSLGIINDNDFLMKGGEVVPFDLEKLQFKHLGISRNGNIMALVNFAESLVLYKEGFRLTPRKHLIVEGGIRLGKRKRSVFLQLQKKWR